MADWRVIPVRDGLGEEGYQVGKTVLFFFTKYWHPLASKHPRWFDDYDRALGQANHLNTYEARHSIKRRTL